jgi:tetratricopeptide (TPR) repeat protein
MNDPAPTASLDQPGAQQLQLCSVRDSFVRFWICALLIAVAVGAFWPVIHNGFINYDDPVYVTANAQVQSGLCWESVHWAFANLDAGFWHPLTWLSLLTDRQLYGLRAGGYHLTSVLLHAANTVLLFLVFQRMTGATWRSAFVAALFALHPLQVESVAWVSERKGVLSTFFWMLALLAYLRFAQCSEPEGLRGGARAKVFYGLGLLFFVCGLMSKAMVVTLPFILLLMDWWPLRRVQRGTIWRLIWEKLPFIAAAIVAALLTIRAERQVGALTIESQRPVGQAIANVISSYGHYVGQLAWPSGLSVHYPCTGGSSFWQAARAALVTLSVTGVMLWAARRRPYAAFGWIWYLVTLLPVSGLIQIGDHTRADRYAYLPAIGIFALVTWGAHDLTKRWRYQAIALSAGAVVLTSVYATLTRRQIAYWKDSETLFRHATTVTEPSYVSETSLGVALADKGRPEQAIIHYQKALAIEPCYADAHSNLGVALAGQGRWDEAITHYQRALDVAPDHADAHNNLGHALLKQGQVDQAIAHFQRALQRKPGFAGAQNNLGVALARKGQVDDAIRHFQEALRLKPNSAEAHYDLGTALLQKGQVEPAIIHFKMALSLRPDYADACHNLGNALLQTGKADEAIIRFRKALEIRPDFAEARNSLGWLLLQSGRADEAIIDFQKALASRPDYAEAHSNLGLALLQKGQVDEAIAHFQKAEEICPADAEAQHNLGIGLLQKGKVDQAIAHFQMAVELRPAFAAAHQNLGTALVRKGQVDQAILHFQKALEIRPRFAEADYSLGNAFLEKRLASEAIAHFQRALESRPDFAAARNNLAWILATCPEASVRNGARAVELAQEANRLSGGNNAVFMGTLGAAYAEAGRFTEAVGVAQRALRLAEVQTNKVVADALQTQIRLYQAGVPVRDAGQTNSPPEPRRVGR